MFRRIALTVLIVIVFSLGGLIGWRIAWLNSAWESHAGIQSKEGLSTAFDTLMTDFGECHTDGYIYAVWTQKNWSLLNLLLLSNKESNCSGDNVEFYRDCVGNGHITILDDEHAVVECTEVSVPKSNQWNPQTNQMTLMPTAVDSFQFVWSGDRWLIDWDATRELHSNVSF